MKKFNLRKKILALTLTVITMFSTVAGILPGGVVHAADASSGTYYGIDWDMDAEGNLTLNSGTCTNVKGTKWNAADVKTVDSGYYEIVCNDDFIDKIFKNSTHLSYADLSAFNTSNVTNMADMFSNCRSLGTLDISNFDTSNVTNMNSMFFNCSNLMSLDVSNFNTENVTNMSYMFYDCENLYSLNVSNFNTANVTSMRYMFSDCGSLRSLNISGLDTSNVTNMNNMFENCNKLTSLDVSSFNTSNVTDMDSMFCNCASLTSLDVSNFDTSNVTCMRSMFSSCPHLASLDVSNFNTENVTTMGGMFSICNSLVSLDVSNFDTSNVTNMNNMFKDCNKLTSLDVSNFNTNKVTSMNSMFYGCKNLASLDVSNFDTSNVTDMGYMFIECNKLTSLDVSNFNTSNVTNMCKMFSNCNSLTSLDVAGFNTSNVTDMDTMFGYCNKLTSLDVSNFDTSNVTNMLCMFVNCKSLTSLDVSGFNTSKVRYMHMMFAGCEKLTSLDLSSFDIGKDTTTFNMLNGCNELEVLTTPKIIKSTDDIALPFTMYNDSNSPYNKLVSNKVVLHRYMRGTYYGIDWALDAKGNLILHAGTTTNQSATDSKWNASVVKTVTTDGPIIVQNNFCQNLFGGCAAESIDLSGFDTSNATNMLSMFQGCRNLKSLNLSSFDTKNVTNMGGMFDGCSSLNSLNISNFNTSSVTNMAGMFNNCITLKSLDLSNFDMSACNNTYMFINTVKSLETLKTPKVKPQDAYRIALPYRMYDNENKKYYSTLDVENVTLQKEPTYPKEETVIHTLSFHDGLFNMQMQLNGTPNDVFTDDEDFLKNTSVFRLQDKISDNYGNGEYNNLDYVATEQGKEFMLSSLKPYVHEDELNAMKQDTVVIDESDIKIDYITEIIDENGSVIQTLPEGKCYIQVTINYNGVEYKSFVNPSGDPEVFNLLPNNIESTTTDSIEASYDENNNLVVKANQTDTYTSGKKITKTVDIDTYGVTDQGTTLLITYDGASTEIEKIVNIEGTLLYNDGAPVQRKVVKLSTPKDMFDLSSDEGHYEFLNVPITNNTMPLSVFDTDDTSACSDDILLTSGVVTFDNTGSPVLDNDLSKEMTLVIEKVTPTVPEREEVVVPTPEVVPTPKPSTTTTIVVPEPIVDNTNSVVSDSVVDKTDIVNLPNVVATAPGENVQSDVTKVDDTVNKNILSEKPKQNDEKITDFSKNSDKDNKKIDSNNEKPSEEKDTAVNTIKENKSSQNTADVIMGISFLLVLIIAVMIFVIFRYKSKEE